LGLDDANHHLKFECGALAYQGFDMNCTLHGLDDVSANHETKSDALLVQPSLVIKLPECLEQFGQLFRGDAYSGVLYFEVEYPLGVIILKYLGLLPIKSSILAFPKEAVTRNS